MNRYNVETHEGNFIQLDIEDSWTIEENEVVSLSIVSFYKDPPSRMVVTVTKKDLETLGFYISSILNK